MQRSLTAALGALLALSLASCGGVQAERAGLGGEAQSRELRVRRDDFVQRFLVTGELKAVRSETIVVPRTTTWQIQIRWLEDDGARVEQGQKVLELDNTALVSDLDEKTLAELRATDALSQKEADLEAQLQDKRLQLEQRRVELEKAEILAAVPEEILRRRDHQERQLALSRARAEYEKARQELESFREAREAELAVLQIELAKARREVEAAERAIDALVLRAPRDGILVIEENPQEGRKFQIGDSTWVGMTVARIPDLSVMEVEAYLNDVDDGRIRVGNPAVCTVDAFPDLRFAGTVREITPIAQEKGFRSLRRSFRVQVALERTDPERMRPGMSVKVEVEAARLAGALLAPRGALDLASEPPLAFLDGAQPREVQIGACNALDCIVEDGLVEGQLLRSRR